MSARILFHPRCFPRGAAEIARSQGGRVEWDAHGRPFLVPAADPLAPPAAPAEPEPDPMRFKRLRRALEALAAWLPPMEEPGRVHPDVKP